MKALVVGCGSIGRRHIANLAGRPDVEEVVVYSRRKDGLDGLEMKTGKIRAVSSLEFSSPDFAMICNETSEHIAAALTLAKRGVPLFIEKPLSNRSVGISRLRSLARRRRVSVFVAYNLRFLGVLRRIEGLLRRGYLGKLSFARIEAGQFLPDWRPHRPWRKTYSARRSLGGGVSLDLSHEIDYMRWFFGEPESRLVERSSVGGLGVDVEDVFEGIYRFKGGFLCSVHLDYLQKPPRRRIRVAGSRGYLECDIIGRRLTVERDGRTTFFRDPALFDVRKTYEDELDYFLDRLKSRRAMVPGLEDGARALELIGV